MNIIAILGMLVGAMIMHLLHAYRHRMQARKLREISRVNRLRAEGIVVSKKMCIVQPLVFREFKGDWDSLTAPDKQCIVQSLLDANIKNDSIVEAALSRLVKDISQ